MKERVVEKHLRLGIEARNGICYKFVSPGRANVPDRLCVLEGIPLYMVETKRPKQDATDAQKREHDRLRNRGVNVYVLNTIALVDAHLAALDKTFSTWPIAGI